MDARSFTATLDPRHLVAASLSSICFAIALGCATDADLGMLSVPWNQSQVTQAAATFARQMNGLYGTAIKDPAFAGERSAYGETLDKLRILREESQELHAQLAAGKTREQTRHIWERITEVARDTRESDSWEFLPTDFSASAESALGSTQELDRFFGVR